MIKRKALAIVTGVIFLGCGYPRKTFETVPLGDILDPEHDDFQTQSVDAALLESQTYQSEGHIALKATTTAWTEGQEKSDNEGRRKRIKRLLPGGGPGGGTGCTNGGFSGVPINNQLDFEYIIGTGLLTFTFPLIQNSQCKFHIALYRQSAPNPYDTSLLTFVDTQLQVAANGVDYSVVAAAKIEMNLTANQLSSNTQLQLEGVAVSEDPTSTTLPISFTFKIQIYYRPCQDNLQLPNFQNQLSYSLGASTLRVPFTGAQNGNCEYSFLLADKLTNLAVTSAAYTLTQATFAFLPQDPLYSPYYKQIVTQGYLDVFTNDSSLIGQHDFRLTVLDERNSRSNTFTIQILPPSSKWRNVPVAPSDGGYSSNYLIGASPLVIVFNQDCTDFEFSVQTFDTTIQGQSLPPFFLLKQPVFNAGATPSVSEYQTLTIDTNDYSLGTQVKSVFVMLSETSNTIPSTSFSFKVTLGFGGCVASPSAPSSLFSTSYTYVIGQPNFDIIDNSSNGQCPFDSLFTRQGQTASLADNAVIYFTKVQFKLPVDPVQMYQVVSKPRLRVQTSDPSKAQIIPVTYRFWDLTTGSEATFDFSLILSNASCSCGITGLPASQTVTYTIGSDWLPFSLASLGNSQCDFRIEIWDTKAGTPLPSGLFLVVQPVLVSNTANSCQLSVAQVAQVRMQTFDWNFEGKTYNVLLVVKSNTVLSDLASASAIMATVTIQPPPCSPSLIAPTLISTSFGYLIGSNALTIPFTGAANGNCAFVATLTDQKSGGAPNSGIFTFTGAVLSDQWPSGPSNIKTVTSDAYLSVQTTDLSTAGTYTFNYLISDPTGTHPAALVQFQVDLYSSLCVKGLRNVPVSGALNRQYLVGSGLLEIPLSTTDNTECKFSVAVFTDAALQSSADPLIYSVVQPTLSVVSGSASNIFQLSADAKIQINTATLPTPSTQTLYVQVNSDKDASDNLYQVFTVSIQFVLTTCTSSLTTSAQMSSLWPSTYLYKVSDPALTVTFSGLSNNNCQFSVSILVTGTMAPIPSWMSLTQPTFNLASLPDLYSVQTLAKLSIASNEPIHKGTYSLTLTLTDPWAVVPSQSFAFSVQVITNPCTKGLRNVPANGQLDTEYTLGQGVQTKFFVSTDNTDCEFAVQVFSDASMSTLASAAIFSVTQPQFASRPGASSPQILDVSAPPAISINSGDFALASPTPVTFFVKLSSKQDSIDSDFAFFTLSVTFTIVQCTPSLTGSQPPDYTYIIGQSPLSVVFSNVSNNNCAFNSVLKNRDGTPLISAFQYLGETFVSVTAPQVFSLQSPARLTVQTTDWTIEGTYQLRLVFSDSKGSRPLEYDFAVKLKNSVCTPGFQGLPRASTPQERLYEIAPKPVLTPYELTGITNSECSFSVAIYDRVEGQSLPTYFTLRQPVFAKAPTAIDPLVQFVATPATIAVSTDDVAQDERVFEVLVVLLSTRFAQDAHKESFVIKFTLLVSCEALFPFEVSPKVTETYVILKDAAKQVVITSRNQRFRSRCKDPFQTTFKLLNFDLSPADLTMFSLAETRTDDRLIATVTITTTSKSKVGLHRLRLIEQDTKSSSNQFETLLEVTATHFCATAELETSKNQLELTYTAGQGALKFGASEQFTIDADHQQTCGPVKVTAAASGDESFNPAWVTFSLDTGQGEVSIEKLNKTVTFTVVATGSIQGDPTFATAQFTFSFKAEPAAAVQTESESETAQANQTATFADILTQKATAESENSELQNLAALQWYQQMKKPAKQEAAVPPNFIIAEVDRTGLMKVEFSKKVLVPNWSLLIKGSFRSQKERLEAFDLTQFLRFKVESDRFSEGDHEISIQKVSLVDFTSRGMDIQIKFASPNAITKDAGRPDQILVTVTNNVIFIDESDWLLIPLETTQFADLPGQLTVAQEEQRIEAEKQLDSTMKAVSWTNLCINLVFAYGLKYLWNAINLLQMAVYFPLWKLNYPVNALSFLKFAKMIVLMEFLPSHIITDPIQRLLGLTYEEDLDTAESSGEVAQNGNKLRSLEPTEDLEQPQSDDGLEEEKIPRKPNIVRAMGIMLALAIVLAIFLVFFFSCRCCIYRDYKCFSRYMNLKQKIFYNAFIRYAIQSTLKLQISACMTLSALNWEESSQLGQGVVSIFLIFVFLTLPVVFVCILWRNYEHLNTLSMRKKIGTLYPGINTESKVALLYTIVFLLRRSLFCFFTFAMISIPGIQVQTFIFSSLLYVIYLNSDHIFESKLQTMQENVNEAIFIVVCYHCVLFGNLVDDHDTLTLIGSSMQTSCAVMLAINILIIVAVNFSQVRHALRICCLKRRHARALQKIALKKAEQAAKRKLELLELKNTQGFIDRIQAGAPRPVEQQSQSHSELDSSHSVVQSSLQIRSLHSASFRSETSDLVEPTLERTGFVLRSRARPLRLFSANTEEGNSRPEPTSVARIPPRKKNCYEFDYSIPPIGPPSGQLNSEPQLVSHWSGPAQRIDGAANQRDLPNNSVQVPTYERRLRIESMQETVECVRVPRVALQSLDVNFGVEEKYQPYWTLTDGTHKNSYY